MRLEKYGKKGGHLQPINFVPKCRVFRLILAILGAVILLEVGLRAVLGLGNPVLYVVDKGEDRGGYGYIPAPDQDVIRFFSESKINDFSMRSEGVKKVKSQQTSRILFIGDSVTYGTTYIDQTRIFTSLLERSLNQKLGHRVEVLNASAGGWAPSNEINFLIRRGTFDADCIVIVINTEDLNQPFAEFEAGPNFPTRKPLTAIGELWGRYILPRLLSAQAALRDPGSIPSSPRRLANQEKAVFAKLEVGREFARRHGAKFVIVYIPSHSKIWDGPAYREAKKSLLAWGVREQVSILDLSSKFPTELEDNLYIQEGDNRIHLSEAGNEVAAESLIGSLSSLLRNNRE